MLTAKMLLAFILQSADINGLTIDTTKIDLQQAYCLAQNVYYESRSEDIKGQFAVASVTINRTKDVRYPSTVCGVVQQTAKSRIDKGLVCAFSWYCENDKKGREIPVKNRDGTINQAIVDQFQIASIVALTTLGGAVTDNTRGATHFHNPYTSKPTWARQLIRTMSVGNHDFYK